jgi:hypothetical protein
MVLSEEVALLCVAREEDEGKREGGIEGRVSDEATDGIARHAFTRKGPIASNGHGDNNKDCLVPGVVVTVARVNCD